MAAQLPPPPPGPPGPPPYGPPGSGPPIRTRVPWWLIAIAVGVVVAVVVIVGVGLAVSGGDADSVEDVADDAVAAAEDLDVDAGIELLCDAPTDEERGDLEALIDAAQDRAGTDDPEVDYDVSDIEGDSEGSFTVTVTSDEEGLDDERLEMRVIVEEHDGRSCIADVEVEEAD